MNIKIEDLKPQGTETEDEMMEKLRGFCLDYLDKKYDDFEDVFAGLLVLLSVIRRIEHNWSRRRYERAPPKRELLDQIMLKIEERDHS